MAVVAAIAVGAYFVIGGGSGGSGSVADDGPHKLIAPTTVLDGTYKKSDSASADSMTDDDIKDFEKWGVKNPKDVSSGYEQGTGLTAKDLTFSGVYGTIDDPEAVVDAMFAKLKSEAAKDDGSGDSTGKLVGSPETVTPAGLDGAIMKCQVAEITNKESTAGTAKTVNMPFCIWGDHSTVVDVLSFDLGSFATGKGGTAADTAELAAKLRKDIRVKV